MGGGWSKQGSGVPLADRVRSGGSAAPSGSAVPGPAAATGETCPSRHCWVADAADGLGVKRPGLLVEWRQAGTGWEGRVVYAARLRSETWAVVEEWVPAALLTPL